MNAAEDGKRANTEDTLVEIEKLLAKIREQFYQGQPDKRFYQDRTILLKAITWPAEWLKERGVTWSGDRYFKVLLDLLVQIRAHGTTAAEIRYFPGYLLKCVQDHFAHNSDIYCDEGKAARHTWERALGKAMDAAGLAKVKADEQLVDTIAQAHRLLATKKRRAKPAQVAPKEPTLFDDV